MKMLIAEDDRNSMKLLKYFLNDKGSVDSAIDGLHAISLIMTAYHLGEPYYFVFLDVMMPNLDGIETLKAIRNFENELQIPVNQRIKAIMVSALNGDTIRAEAYEHGCFAYVHKPLNFEELERIIQDGMESVE